MTSRTKTIAGSPALSGYLEKAGSETIYNYNWLVQHDFGRVFRKYLKNADEGVLAVFFEEFSLVDKLELLKHRDAVEKEDHGDNTFGDLMPVDVLTLKAQAGSASKDEKAGCESLELGLTGAIAFAGGAATRFGTGLEELRTILPAVSEKLSDGIRPGEPKGCFPIGPVEGLSFYDIFAAQVLETGIRTGKLPVAFLMISDVTAPGTRRWLDGSCLWGLPCGALGMFSQGRNPRLDDKGDLLASSDGRLVWTGDGHGGVFSALIEKNQNGGSLLGEIASTGTASLVLFNIDNPAARPFWPRRLGRHARAKMAFTMSTVEKAAWDEKIGVACFDSSKGLIDVVEYNVLDERLAKRTNSEGGLLYSAGNINVNIVDLVAIRDDLDPSIYTGKMVVVDGRERASSSIEYLNQHLIRKLKRGMVQFFEVDRKNFFMPTKNVVGSDSVVTSYYALADMYGRWLEAAGASISRSEDGRPDAFVELHPCVAMDVQDPGQKGIGRGWKLKNGSRLYLCAAYDTDGGRNITGNDLVLGEKASFIVRTELPYGNPAYNAKTRSIRPEPQSAGKLRIGSGVVLENGVKLDVTIEGDGEFIIGDRKSIARDIKLNVKPGQKVVI